MSDIIRYCVFKTYKGLFIKKHAGNSHMIMFSSPTSTILLNILGKIDDGNMAAQLVYRADSMEETNILNALKSDKNFVVVEELSCKTIEKQKTDLVITIPKKGSFILSNLSITFEPEHSSGNTQIYFIKGKFALAFDENLTPTQFKMKAIKQKAKLSKSMTKALRSM